MNKLSLRVFSRLVLWEIENSLNSPTISLIVASAIIVVLVQSATYQGLFNSYIPLYHGTNIIFLALTLVACTLFSHSFAGSFGNGELKRLLSYPVKRWQVFFSRIISLNLIIFGVYASAYTLNLYLNPINLLEPLFYVSLFAIFLQLLFVCSVSMGISMLTKNELISVIASFLLFLGIDNAFGIYSIFSSDGRFRYIFGYFEQITRSGPYMVSSRVPITFEQITSSILFPLLVAVVVLVAVFIYFTRKMEID